MKIHNFSRFDMQKVMEILTEIEIEYREEAPKHTPERALVFLATARGASIAKKRISDYLKKKYNILKL